MRLFQIAQIIVSILLITTILLQNRGGGVSGLFGGSGGNNFSTKRGLDQTLFKSTIVLAFIFFAISIASLIF